MLAGVRRVKPKSRMREILKSGSVRDVDVLHMVSIVWHS